MQDAADTCTPEQLAALDAEIDNLRTQTAALNATAKTLRCTLASVTSTLSTADLIASVDLLEREKVEIEERLDGLRKGKARMVSLFSSSFFRHHTSHGLDWGFSGVKEGEQGIKIANETWKHTGDTSGTSSY